MFTDYQQTMLRIDVPESFKTAARKLMCSQRVWFYSDCRSKCSAYQQAGRPNKRSTGYCCQRALLCLCCLNVQQCHGRSCCLGSSASYLSHYYFVSHIFTTILKYIVIYIYIVIYLLSISVPSCMYTYCSFCVNCTISAIIVYLLDSVIRLHSSRNLLLFLFGFALRVCTGAFAAAAAAVLACSMCHVADISQRSICHS